MAAAHPRDGTVLRHFVVTEADPWVTYSRFALKGAAVAALAGVFVDIWPSSLALALMASVTLAAVMGLTHAPARATATPALALALGAAGALLGLLATVALPLAAAALMLCVLAVAART